MSSLVIDIVSDKNILLIIIISIILLLFKRYLKTKKANYLIELVDIFSGKPMLFFTMSAVMQYLIQSYQHLNQIDFMISLTVLYFALLTIGIIISFYRLFIDIVARNKQ